MVMMIISENIFKVIIYDSFVDIELWKFWITQKI